LAEPKTDFMMELNMLGPSSLPRELMDGRPARAVRGGQEYGNKRARGAYS